MGIIRMTNTTKRILFLQKFAILTFIAKAYGIDFIVSTFYRSPEQQKIKFVDGKSNFDGYKRKSAHQRWLAMDIVIIKKGKTIWERNEDYEQLGQIWKDLHGIWGGSWKWKNDDIYHMQFGDI